MRYVIFNGGFMMTNKVPFSFIVVIGLMLFALFFGAGNLIFPAMLGQSAGTNVWSANAGFLVTGVGLPLLGVLAFGISGKEDLQSLASRVHPVFGVVFTTVLYLAIGPLFAIPRTGNVSFEIGVKPFVPESLGSMPLIIFTIIFFSITCFFSLNPAKIVDIVGKILTPIKLTFIGILVIVAFIHPIGDMQAPVENYTSHAFFKGFQEGYLTMDTLASFVFGIIIINAIKEKGAKTKKQIMVVCAKATIIAATTLAIIYTALSYMGASSVAKLGHLDNGGAVLAKVSNYYFGSYGGILLGLMITVACLTTSVGLVSACSSFFHKLFPKVSYKKIAIMLSVFSAIVANVGLTQLIAISVPVLTAIYPLAIVLIFLTFLHPLFKGRSEVYQASLLVTFIISLFDGLGVAGVNIQVVNQLFTQILPMHEVGLGWIFPAIIGGLIGYGISYLRMKGEIHSNVARVNK
ncbi:branched-chain amino acid transport system II carrier protein [Bacillus pseudomycoides]|nr:branched-chain amino acid transport system II carrier protein [Bacillus pseudomycoides]PEJ38872.1 branched-chain amino acid transport system II carrier protein [Bacillus pseudomycoides]PEM41276.1 branched-chain amino acid transport system II carrier protein [Bacillus pseudomycoides]PEU41966.1 branched-chain amino acid transport system II carrier protein [Bacillus pseudomycoides]PFY14732.1 branched-chain amino acid transport system II carrier protein [Bacillus pseudomycoides]